MDIEGKRILLSGATGGLGRAIAERLAGEGAELVLSSRKRAELNELAKSLRGGAERHRVLVADLAREGAAEKLVRDASKEGGLDGLVANAGLPGSGRVETYSQKDLARVVRVNLEAPMRMTRELLPQLLERGEGHLVFVSSINGIYATARASIYAATKFGLRGFAFGLREDLHGSRIGASVVSPGFVRDAGLFADTGLKAPPSVGTTTPRKVGEAVARSIRRNRSEIAVAPLRQVIGAKFAARHRELAGAVTRSKRNQAVADAIVAGQTHKR